MNNSLMFLCFLVLLLAPLRSATQDLSELLAKLHDLDVEDEGGYDDELEFLDFPSPHSGRTNKVLINVDGFGAVGDGVADDTKVLRRCFCLYSCKDLMLFWCIVLGLCQCMETSLLHSKISSLGS